MKFFLRHLAAQLITEHGIPTTAQGLADKACDGIGPRYAIVNGRAVYTEADLLNWIAEQAARPVVRRSQRKAAPAETNAEQAANAEILRRQRGTAQAA
jgi:hypothetical protein